MELPAVVTGGLSGRVPPPPLGSAQRGEHFLARCHRFEFIPQLLLFVFYL